MRIIPPTTHTHGCVYQVSVVVVEVVVLVLAVPPPEVVVEDEVESCANANAVTNENIQNRLSFLNADMNVDFIKMF